MALNTAGHEVGSYMAMWNELCMFVALIDGNFECDDDQSGVVYNACIHADLAYGA